MEAWHFVWMLAALTGLVTAGVAGSGWAVIAGRRPSLSMLMDIHITTPIRALALMIYAPLGLMNAGAQSLDDNPAFAICLLSFGLFWGFMQGVFVLTTFFGFT